MLSESQILNEIQIDTLSSILKDEKKRQRLLSAINSNNVMLTGPKEITDSEGKRLSR